ncbi:hypothetical protein L6452_37597 [Arctium lappa]|uniref:Uncharacterized protein n=1 Tax=Arctium lappa TaxID=4217 RepID=A0ACB8Y3I1_ARCLA|nr:hypothetical protein L6452_37597 [Arctium lappa]
MSLISRPTFTTPTHLPHSSPPTQNLSNNNNTTTTTDHRPSLSLSVSLCRAAKFPFFQKTKRKKGFRFIVLLLNLVVGFCNFILFSTNLEPKKALLFIKLFVAYF